LLLVLTRIILAVKRGVGEQQLMSADEDLLIAHYIEDDPYRPGPADARLKEYGTAIWALISYMDRALGGDVEQTAADYEVPVAAVEAARAYYNRHRELVDARIALNAA
jgi:hypothetical protein